MDARIFRIVLSTTNCSPATHMYLWLLRYNVMFPSALIMRREASTWSSRWLQSVEILQRLSQLIIKDMLSALWNVQHTSHNYVKLEPLAGTDNEVIRTKPSNQHLRTTYWCSLWSHQITFELICSPLPYSNNSILVVW